MDKRKIIESKGVFPYRVTGGALWTILDLFLKNGHSVHSPRALTLGIVVEHCIENEIPFTLKYLPSGGYFLERKKEADLIGEMTCTTQSS